MKISILLGITTMLLLALPAAASDFTLEIFGNANEDDTINMQDVTYTELIILEYRDETELTDAKYDGKINMQDVTQIELIILGKELELTIIDAAGNDVTVPMPVERAAVNTYSAAAFRVLDAEDRIVGVTDQVVKRAKFFPDLSQKPSVGSWDMTNTEAILELNPDTAFTYANWPSPDKLEDKLAGTGIVAVRLDLYKPKTLREEMDKLGYLLGERDSAGEYLDWYDGYVDEIDDRVSQMSEDDKPRVFLISTSGITDTDMKTYTEGTGMGQQCARVGGINIAADLGVDTFPKVSVEWVLEQNPEVIAGGVSKGGWGADDGGEIVAEYEKILDVPGFDNVGAVENDRVYVINNDILYSPAMPAGLVYLAKWFHPEVFDDLDPQVIQQEYVDKFCGIDFDVTEEGAFVHPPFAS